MGKNQEKRDKGSKGTGQKGPQPPKQVPNREHYSRISYLIQASNYFNNDPKYSVLSRNLTRTADLVSKKTVSKLTPNLKRMICSRCNTLLVHGLTETKTIENSSRLKNYKSDVLVSRCQTCRAEKRFPIGKDLDYTLFSEREGVAFNV